MTIIKEVFNILVIEDDISEQKLIKMLIKDSGFNAEINILNDGEEAIHFINSSPETGELFPKIDLIFLDLNLPKINGIDVLLAIKRHKKLRILPVIVLTTSNSTNDVAIAYESGASGYIRKPSVIDEYEKTISGILHYWFEICLIPKLGRKN